MKVGSDADFLYYNVELHTVTGSVCVCVCLARTLLNVKHLQKWSVGELALLQFLQMGVPPQFGLPRTVLWRECVHLLGAYAIVAKLHELTGYIFAKDLKREADHCCYPLQDDTYCYTFRSRAQQMRRTRGFQQLRRLQETPSCRTLCSRSRQTTMAFDAAHVFYSLVKPIS